MHHISSYTTYVEVGCEGRISEGGVLRNSNLFSALSAGNLHLPTMSLKMRVKFQGNHLYSGKVMVFRVFLHNFLCKSEIESYATLQEHLIYITIETELEGAGENKRENSLHSYF
jgi:hypothetical protein